MEKVIFFVIFTLCVFSVHGVEHPENFVNLLTGTFTDGRKYSTGNTLPLIGRPWGFNHWAPQTKPQDGRSDSWWFSGNDHTFYWLRCTHQPSPWIGDYGWFLFAPQIGGYSPNPSYWWEPRGAILKPHLLDVTLAPHGMRIELTPTNHGAAMRVTFPPSAANDDKRVCFREGEWTTHKDLLSSPYITGVVRQVNTDRMRVPNFAMHIHAVSMAGASAESQGGGTCFKLGVRDMVAEIRLATSFISSEQAKSNLEMELPSTVSFDELKSESEDAWRIMLKRVDVVDAGELSGDNTRHLSIFYTGLYRALTFPRRLDEVDHKTGELIHFSPYDQQGKVHKGILVTDNGFWDTFRTVYPLLGLAYRKELGEIVEGWLNAYKEGGWLPAWASPGYRNCMVGTFADVVVSDAIVKNVGGFDLETARLALKKDAFEQPPPYAGNAFGKDGLHEYTKLGYVPTDRGNAEGVSRTLDFAFADFATAKAYQHLAEAAADYLLSHSDKKDELLGDASRLLQRVERAVPAQFSKQHGLMVPKKFDGGFAHDFNAVEWGKGYVEGNSWHHSFPPYALDILVKLYGGKDQLLAKLHELVEIKSDFRVGSYHQEIHEMTEMRSLAMGQYGHNNQPSHHILYLYALLGDKESTEKYVREVMNRGYGEDFYAGDEDNGEMGSWYVLSALGLFSTTPGTPDYVLNTPLFKHTIVHRGDNMGNANDDFHIIAPGADMSSIHTAKVLLDGQDVSSPLLSDYEIKGGRVLQFVMTSEKESTAVTIEDARAAAEGEGEYEAQLSKQGDIIKDLQTQLEELRKHPVADQSRQLPSPHNNLEPQYEKLRRDASNPDVHSISHPQAPPSLSASADGPHQVGCGVFQSHFQIALIVICVNLAVLCIMLVVQISKDERGSNVSEAGGRGGNIFWRALTSCCNPLALQQLIARLFGLQTLHSVVGRPNKQELYTV